MHIYFKCATLQCESNQVWWLAKCISQAGCSHKLHFAVTLLLLFSCKVVSDSATPWTAAHQAPPSFTIFQNMLRFMSIESVMPSNHLIHPPSPFAFNLFQHQSLFQWVSSSHQLAKVLQLQLQHLSFQCYSGLISFRIDCFDLLAVQLLNLILI